MQYGERFEQALQYAARLHRMQSRKGSNVPYVTHLLATAAIVGEAGGNEDEMIAALLHDAVEDQGGEQTRMDIRARFGEAVANIVDGCTDTDQQPKPPWRKRKEAFIENLSHASASVRRVVVADKLHNARCILLDLRCSGDELWDRFTGGKDGTLWYFDRIFAVLSAGPADPWVAELGRVVREIDSLAR